MSVSWAGFARNVNCMKIWGKITKGDCGDESLERLKVQLIESLSWDPLIENAGFDKANTWNISLQTELQNIILILTVKD